MSNQMIAELQAKLATTTDPDEYDRIQDAIRQAQKDTHLAAAGQEVTKRQKEAQRRAEIEKQYKSATAEAARLLDGFIHQDGEIKRTLAAAYEALRARYQSSQAYQAAATEARYTAELLGIEAPQFPNVNTTTPGDLASPQHFAKSVIALFGDEYEMSQRLAERNARLTGQD